MPGFVSDSGSCSMGELERCGLLVRILRGSDGKKALGLPSGCPWRWIGATLLCAIAFLAPAAAAARDLVVYGEPTLEKALKSVGSLWQARTGTRVNLFVAPTNLPYAQIDRGARRVGGGRPRQNHPRRDRHPGEAQWLGSCGHQGRRRADRRHDCLLHLPPD